MLLDQHPSKLNDEKTKSPLITRMTMVTYE